MRQSRLESTFVGTTNQLHALDHGLLVSRTMREAFIGFDSAWAGKVPGGIVWATFEDQHLAAFAGRLPIDISGRGRLVAW